MEKYDVIVIGAGAAGLGCSGVANFLGLKTLLVEKNEGNFGGDCTNSGCVPSKALIHIANKFHQARQASGFGLQVSGQADMKEVLAYIHDKQRQIRQAEDASALRAKGIDVLIGEATFSGRDTILVSGSEYRGRVVFLCSGSRPLIPEIPGLDGQTVYTNENIFTACTSLPARLLVIGGGPMGCELGQAFSRLGSEVTIVNRDERLLSKEPQDVSRILQEQLEQEGIRIFNNTTVRGFSGQRASLEQQGQQTSELECSAVLLAVGRVSSPAGLQVEKAGISLTETGDIWVDKYLRTTNKKVYVVGDAAGTYKFSHGAEKMVRQVWRNLLIPVFRKENSKADLSWVTFTDPQVAHFGFTEQELQEEKLEFSKYFKGMEDEDRAVIEGYHYGLQTLWLEKRGRVAKKKILSGSMIAPQAGELVQELQLAKHAGIPVGKILSRVYPYPVAARVNQHSLSEALRKSYSRWMIVLARKIFRLWH